MRIQPCIHPTHQVLADVILSHLCPFVLLLACLQLYHTSACPQEAYSYVDDTGIFGMRTEHMKAFVGDDGSLHLVADRESLKDQIYSLDLERARMLTKVSPM